MPYAFGLNRLAGYLYGDRQGDESVKLLEKALQIAEDIHGKEDSLVVDLKQTIESIKGQLRSKKTKDDAVPPREDL